jgi:hypothetical protein
MSPRNRRVPAVVVCALVGTASALALSGAAALGLFSPFAAAFAQSPGQTALLSLRFGLLATVGCALEARAAMPASHKAAVLSGLGMLLVVSLAAQGALLLFVVASLGSIVALSLGNAARAPMVSPWALAAVIAVPLTAVAGLRATHTRSASSVAPTPQDEIDRWLRVGNPWRARWAAFVWAETEEPPGRAYIALAQRDADLGRRSVAVHVLRKVVAGAASPPTRDRAQRLIDEWTE